MAGLFAGTAIYLWFAANQAVIAAMMAKEDRIAADRLSHASLLEAASLSPSQLRRFAHNDVTHLARLLASPLSGAANGGDRRRVQHGRR
ncbi:8-amino-7-oxononanoate synthase [Escherichia coli]|uniref:8-amino-7-oxononanoate synthase n=1 Tax=Escherichia coli TaxID=562 RepID=A0A376UDM8_ECOLX|nr:8-amino-7-oxononanoate synthase [Escherichia coli]